MSVDTKREVVRPIEITIGEKDEKVVVGFSEVVTWVEMEPLKAIRLGEQIKAAAIGILRSSPTITPPSREG